VIPVIDRLRGRRRWAIVAACAATLGVLGTLPSPAAASSGAIHGTVTSDATAAPVDNYRVDLYDAGKTQVATTCTAADGTYGFTGLATASFYVNFSGKTGCGPPSDFAPEWWNGHFAGTLADPIGVVNAHDSTGIDASLRAGAQVLGTVTDAVTTLPVPNVTVEVHDNFGNLLTSVCSVADGTYVANRMVPGVDTVRFVSDGNCGAVAGYETQYYNDAATLATASPVNIATGAIVQGIDAHLVMPIPHTLTVAMAGTGSGSIASTPAGIACPATCAAQYDSATSVTLTATPASGSTFTGWSGGGCAGTGTCSVPMSVDRSVIATFTTVTGGGTPPPPSGGATPTPPGSAPSCTLRVSSARVLKPGRLKLRFRCDQGAAVSVRGTVTERIPKTANKKARTKRFTVKAAHATATAGHDGTVTVTLPAGALSALRKHRRESAAFTLTATGPHGVGRATATVRRLRS
jgi:hypothetical protein